jgi:hypothetical protein
VRKIAHNTTANSANHCITKTGHESLKREMWDLSDKGQLGQTISVRHVHTHTVICVTVGWHKHGKAAGILQGAKYINIKEDVTGKLAKIH